MPDLLATAKGEVELFLRGSVLQKARWALGGGLVETLLELLE
jgi:hypothetical protein